MLLSKTLGCQGGDYWATVWQEATSSQWAMEKKVTSTKAENKSLAPSR